MKEEQKKEKNQAREYILSYLNDNPNAGDTLEGIAEWWLQRQRIRFEVSTVKQVLDTLVEDGLIEEQSGPDSRVIYRAKSKKK